MKSHHFAASLAVGVLVLWLAQSAPAQNVPPIFAGGVSAFEPEIGVVNTGVINDVQATVSADLKYVTLNMQPQSSNLIALHEFAFEMQTNMGLVGTPPAPAPGPHEKKVHAAPKLAVLSGHPGAINPPVILGAGSGLVLNQQGMTRLAPAK